MNKRIFLSAAAAAILAFSTGSLAMAADVNGATERSKVVLDAGKDPSNLQLHFPGAQKITILGSGMLQITRANGSTWKYRPDFSQNVNGKKKYVVPGFRLIGQDRVALFIDKHDASAPLLLDGPTS